MWEELMEWPLGMECFDTAIHMDGHVVQVSVNFSYHTDKI